MAEKSILFEGSLMKKGWMSWSKRWFRLNNMKELQFFKDDQNFKASGTINLSSLLEIEPFVPEVRVKKEHCFMLKVLEEENIPVSYYLAADTEKLRLKWLKRLQPIVDEVLHKKDTKLSSSDRTKTVNRTFSRTPKRMLLTKSRGNELTIPNLKRHSLTSLPNSPRIHHRTTTTSLPRPRSGSFTSTDADSSPDMDRPPTPPRQAGWTTSLTAITKSVVSRVVVSRLGKRILRDWVSPDGISFLLIMRGIVVKQSGMPEEGDIFEQIVLKTFTDAVLLITNRTIPKEKVLLTRDPIFQLWSDVLDMLEISFVFDQERLVAAIDDTWNAINTIIFPHLEIERQDQLDKYVALFGDADFIGQFYTSDKWAEERVALKTILRRVWETTFSRTS